MRRAESGGGARAQALRRPRGGAGTWGGAVSGRRGRSTRRGWIAETIPEREEGLGAWGWGTDVGRGRDVARSVGRGSERGRRTGNVGRAEGGGAKMRRGRGAGGPERVGRGRERELGGSRDAKPEHWEERGAGAWAEGWALSAEAEPRTTRRASCVGGANGVGVVKLQVWGWCLGRGAGQEPGGQLREIELLTPGLWRAETPLRASLRDCGPQECLVWCTEGPADPLM